MLKILYVLLWIIFVGICIEAGGFIVSSFFGLVNPKIVKNLWLWHEVDVSGLFHYDQWYFFVLTLLMSIVAVMKALLFYLIVKIFSDKKLNISQPFNKEMGSFISKVSYLALGIGLFSFWGVKYTGWLVNQGVKMPGIESLRLGGADVWLFMSVTLFVIAQIFKRGIEIQTENELTI